MAASWRRQLVAGNETGDVPDIFEGAHNGIGEYVRNGILAPIDLGSNAANFQEEAINGVTWDGSTYGVPWAVENVAMLTNTDLSPECPATLDEAVANAKTLIDAGTTTLGIALQIGETGDGYHWYPLYSADGGYAFARNADGSYDIDDMGVGKEGSIAAGERLAAAGRPTGSCRRRSATTSPGRRSPPAVRRTSSPARGRSPSRPRRSATS